MNEGKTLKKIREELGIGQSELAKKIGKTRMMIYRYENELTTIPNETLKKILEILKIDMETFEKENKKIEFDETVKLFEVPQDKNQRRNEILNNIKELEINVYLDIEATNLIFIKNGQELLEMPLDKIENFYQLDIFNQFLLDGFLEIETFKNFISANNYLFSEKINNKNEKYFIIMKDDERYTLTKNQLYILFFDTMYAFFEKLRETTFPF